MARTGVQRDRRCLEPLRDVGGGPAPIPFVPAAGEGPSRESRERGYRVVSEQLARLAAGEPLLNVIGDRGY